MEQNESTYVGHEVDIIDVRISHRIIQLFSEGLYSSSNKAIEELVSNSFDAGANNVHVILSPDLTDPYSTIAVVDDGEGMDIESLKQHWVIGKSTRRSKSSANGRKPIGKFGIGKLATYVLADKLTHLCKSDGKYLLTTMNYQEALTPTSPELEADLQNGIYDEKKISIPIRELTEEEAKRFLHPWISGDKTGYRILQLFGDSCSPSWTVAVLSNLKSMGKKIQRGKLKWVLRTAMPLRDDFKLFLDGDLIEPSKIEIPIIQKWIIGKDLTGDNLRSPCPNGLEVNIDDSYQKDSEHYYGLSHPILGRITGYIELFESDITGGKSAEWGRSNGFFVYVRGRMINTGDEDDGFGIQRNQLRHGTFSQFRMVVHIDNLDEVLRSSRESLLEGESYILAQDFLHASFNYVRNKLVEYENLATPGAQFASRIKSTPGSITRTPLLGLVELAIENKVKPIYTLVSEFQNDEDKQKLLKLLQQKIETREDLIVSTEFSALDSTRGIAIYDFEQSKLIINSSHPFVASFQDYYSKPLISLPLEMYAVTEIITEAHLHLLDLDERIIKEILMQRDELLRYLVRSSTQRTPGMVALALLDAKDNETNLEIEMRAAFEVIGFDNVIRIGGKGKPDGTAEAYLSATEEGVIQRYKVGLEAKSGGVVSAKRLGISGIARHMDDFKCDHHIVIGNGFETLSGENSASVREINELKNNRGKTVTLMLIDDLARLVRLVPAKRIGLNRLKELFSSCISPEHTKQWINTIERETQIKIPYKEILETIWKRAQSKPDHPIEYASVMTALEFAQPPLLISKLDLINHCKAMQIMAPGIVFARENTVEIRRRPDLVLSAIEASINEYPENERKSILL